MCNKQTNKRKVVLGSFSRMYSCCQRLTKDSPLRHRYHHGGGDRGLQEDGRQPGQRSHAHRRQFRWPHHAGNPGLDQPGPLQVPRWVHRSTSSFYVSALPCLEMMIHIELRRASRKVSSCYEKCQEQNEFKHFIRRIVVGREKEVVFTVSTTCKWSSFILFYFFSFFHSWSCAVTLTGHHRSIINKTMSL